MKYILFLWIGLILLGLSSCNSWLDIKPETEVNSEIMFEKQQGFQDALIGVYLEMKKNSVYGTQLVYGTIEYLAQHWEAKSDENLEALSRYNYLNENVQSKLEGIYRQLYLVITMSNALLEQIDSKKEVFEPGMYEIIKGEALAIRAYCHFDLLRLFGPMPSSVKTNKVLPYVKVVSIQYHDHHTYEEFTAFLQEDLNEAERLLKLADPILASQIEMNMSITASDFLKARQTRMNYYAVMGIQARFHLWLGGSDNMTKAYTYAKEVKDAVDKEDKLLYRLGSAEEISAEDYSFSCEHIAAIYDYEMYSRVAKTFKESSAYTKSRDIVVSDLYSPGTTDLRFTGLWIELTTSNGSKAHVIKKFWQKEESGAINQIPLLRLAEIYLIMMECGTLEEANTLYEEFCLSRDIPIVNIGDATQLRFLLIEEYNKEFYGEGQAFYMYKRLGVEDILWAQDTGNESAYVISLPLTEVNYQ